MSFFSYQKRISIIIICIVTAVVSYTAYINTHVTYITINTEFDLPIYMDGPVVSNDLYGNFMQIVDVPQGIEHQMQMFVPSDDVEHFIARAQPNSSFIQSLTDKEMIQDLNPIVSDSPISQVEQSIQMVEVSDDVNHLITTFTPNSDIEYFIDSSLLDEFKLDGLELDGLMLQDLKPLENTTE